LLRTIQGVKGSALRIACNEGMLRFFSLYSSKHVRQRLHSALQFSMVFYHSHNTSSQM